MVLSTFRAVIACGVLCFLGIGCAHIPKQELFKASAFTKPGLFTDGIEGPACDREGNVYVVNFREQGTIGRVSAEGQAELFVKLPDGSIGNGIAGEEQ